MRYWQKFRLDLLICTAFLLLPLLLLADVTFGGKTMLPVDNLYQWEPWASAAEEQGITTPQNPLISDLIIQNYNWRKFTKESFLEQGEIPLWNPYLFAGVPFLAAGQHSAYYPLSLLFFFMPIPAAYGWFALLQLWLTGVFMYLFARVLGTGRGGAAIAGLVYQGSGFMLTSTAVFPMIIAAAAWLPLLLACIELIINRDWRSESRELASHHQSPMPQSPLIWVAAGAIALGLQIFAGHVEITYYTLLIMGLYAAYRLLTNRPSSITTLLRQAGWLAAMAVLGLMLGAVQLIPLFELGQVNFRQDATTFEQVQSYAFPVRRVLTLAMPNFYGSPAHHSTVDPFTGQTIPFTVDAQGNPNPTSEWGIKNYVEGGIYLGILPLLLAVLGTAGGWLAGSRRRIHTVFFAGLSFLSLAFIFGTPLYAIIYYGLPFANQLNTPFRWVFPLTLAVAVLAGFGIDGLEIGDWRLGTFNLQFLVSNLAVLGGLGVLAGLFVSWWGYGRFQPIITRLFNTLALANTGFANAHEFYSYEFWQVLVFGLMLLGSGLVLWLGKNSKNSASFAAKLKPYWLLLAFLLLTADLAIANWGFHAANDPALLAYKPKMVSWLEEQEGLWRLTSYTPQGDKPFNANSAWLFNFQDVRGYDSMIPKQYTDYMGAVEPQHELPFNRVQPIKSAEALDSPLLDVLNVRFVITSSTIESPKYRLAWEGEGVRIYENLGAAPRAYTLPFDSTAVSDAPLTALTKYDPRQYVVIDDKDWKVTVGDSMPAAQSPQPARLAPAPVAEYTNIQLTTHAEVSEPSWLVIGDTYFPGWKAYIRPFGTGEDQETQAPIVRVNGNFRGVVLEPGHWTIRMRYSPVSFQLGALASFMGGIILLFAGVVWVWQHMVNPNAKMTTTRSIAKNSLAPMALNLFNKFIDFGYAAFYLRVLGPADAGSFATAIATAGIFEIIANFGLDILLIRDVSQAKEQAGRYLLNTSLLRIGMAVVGALPVAALVLGSQLGDNPFSQAEVLAIALIVAGMVFSGMSKGVTGLFYVYEQAEVPAAMTTVTTILKVGLGVAALFMGLGFVGLAAVSIIVNIITLSILTILALRRYTLTGPWTIDWTLQRQLLQKGYPLMLIHLLQTIFISIDVVILRLLLPNGEEVVGWYNSAYKWFNALQIVPSFFTLALFPIISRQIQSSIDGARRMYQMALKLMLLLALPVAAVTFFLAVPLVNIVAGAEFLPDGAVALQIVILSIPFGWMNSVTNYVLIALGLERMQPRAFLVAVIFNIVTNVLFIPMFTYRAAAVTTILSEVVLLVLFDYYLRKKMAGVNWLRFAGRPFLITAIMGAGMYLGGQIHILVGLLAGLLIYPAGLWLLRVVGSEERLILAEILPTSIAARLRLRP